MDHVLNKSLKLQAELDRKTSKGADFPSDQQAQQDEPVTADATLTIGKVAKMAQVSADTVRYYEKEGLLNPIQKSDAGYRLYNEEAMRRLNFIKHAQHCGLSLSEIRELLEIKRRDDSCCNDVRAVAIHKRLQLESKIKALQVMSNALSELIEVCTDDGKSTDECPILAALETSLKNGRNYS
jgi:Zn(II)-responsive transcriptional regulator